MFSLIMKNFWQPNTPLRPICTRLVDLSLEMLKKKKEKKKSKDFVPKHDNFTRSKNKDEHQGVRKSHHANIHTWTTVTHTLHLC